MAREATFNFIPASQMANHSDAELIVSYNKTQRQLFFSSKSKEALDMIGKFVRFYVDVQKNTLAWHIFEKEKGFEALTDLKEVKSIKIKTGPGGKYSSIKIIVQIPIEAIRSLKIKPDGSYKKMVVKKYKPISLLTENQFYYISFNEKKED